MATWLEDIVTALKTLGGKAKLQDIYEKVEELRTKPLSKTWRNTIRCEIERRSSDSVAFTGKKDIFYSIHGLGEGWWGLRNYRNK